MPKRLDTMIKAQGLDKATLTQRLTVHDLLSKAKALGVKQKDLFRLLSSPMYSPDEWQSQYSINLIRIKNGREPLRSLLKKTAIEIESFFGPISKGMQSCLVLPGLDIDALVKAMRVLADGLSPSADYPEHMRIFSGILDRLAEGSK